MATSVKATAKDVAEFEKLSNNEYVFAGQPGSLQLGENQRVVATVVRYNGFLNFEPGSKKKNGERRLKGFAGFQYTVSVPETGALGTILCQEKELPTSVELVGQKQGDNVTAILTNFVSEDVKQ